MGVATCSILVLEVRRALDRLGRSDLEILSFPSVCHLPRVPSDRQIIEVTALLRRCEDVIGLCSSDACLPTLQPTAQGRLRLL